MRTSKTYNRWLLSGILMLLMMLVACSSGDDSPSNKAVLKIYVFPPDHPIVTRADNTTPNVLPLDGESTIHTLHVWVFEHHEDPEDPKDGKFVGYISLDDIDISGAATGTEVLMNITDPSFVTRLPNVDVYVMANVTDENCGLELNGNTTRDELDAAMIENTKFGINSVESVVKAVPDGVGLPMSGVRKNLEVFGTSPVFGVGSKSTKQLTNVKLVRAVSKVHFVFCSSKNDDGHTVDHISIDGATFPTAEFLFLNDDYSAAGGSGTRFKVGGTYESGNKTIMNTSTAITPITSEDKAPSNYEWTNQSGQVYETLIAGGITANDLNDLGTYYLRESDKKITGTITYDGDRTATFSLRDAGDFGRNHTWIVYAYFKYDVGLNVVTVKVNDWQSIDDPESDLDSHEVYNW